MNTRHCDNCGYELIGLGMRGNCPECGATYGMYGSTDQREPLLVRHGMSIGLGILTSMILACGGLLSIWSTKPVHLIATTLTIVGVIGGGAALMFWVERKQE